MLPNHSGYLQLVRAVPSWSDLVELASETESHKRSGRAKGGEWSGAEEKQVTERKGLEEDQGNLGLPEGCSELLGTVLAFSSWPCESVQN